MFLKQRPDVAEADVADMRSEPSSNEPAEIVDRFARLRLAKSEQRCAARGRGIGVQMLLPTRIGGGADSFERGNVCLRSLCPLGMERIEINFLLGGRVAKKEIDRSACPWRPCSFACASICSARRDIAYRSEEHTSELQSLMRISYAVFCLKKK